MMARPGAMKCHAQEKRRRSIALNERDGGWTSPHKGEEEEEEEEGCLWCPCCSDGCSWCWRYDECPGESLPQGKKSEPSV